MMKMGNKKKPNKNFESRTKERPNNERRDSCDFFFSLSFIFLNLFQWISFWKINLLNIKVVVMLMLNQMFTAKCTKKKTWWSNSKSSSSSHNFWWLASKLHWNMINQYKRACSAYRLWHNFGISIQKKSTKGEVD